ncbi:MAG TPA: valine--tRNA ligase, partial [Stellaceae bacterium]|nr:valine--tRNA ligase [Stellaceae bacterium]
IEGAEVETRIRGHGEAIRRLARLKSIVPKPEAGTARAVQVVVEGATLFLDLAGAIDFDRERARLQKEAKDAAAELERIERKLQNPQFVAKAKAEVIEEQREREVEARAALARIEAALKRLS